MLSCTVASHRCRQMAVAMSVCVLAAVSPLSAQRSGTAVPATATVLNAVAERITANDSLGALTLLDTALVYDRKNGTLWNRYGQIAWGMSKTEKGPFMRPHMIQLRMRADSAFRYATAFAPDSAKYYLDLGLYAMETNIVWIRAGAKGTFADGIKLAEAQSQNSLRAALMDQVGMFSWRDYDNVSSRALVKSPDFVPNTAIPVSRGVDQLQTRGDQSSVVPSGLATPDRVYRGDQFAYYRDLLSPITPRTGEASFVEALRTFRNAYTVDPNNERIQRHVYMALADHHSWPDVLSETDQRLRTDPENINAWLGRGLAATSLGDYANAAVAFDNALRRMTSAERQSFADIRRLLAPSPMHAKARFADSLRWQALSAVERQRQETLFWSLADPRQSTRVNEALVEFYARVTYADLLFGSEEFRIRGADSDRGDTYVRYGPPDDVFSFHEDVSTTIIWLYNKQKLAFTFTMSPTFGTAYFPRDDAASVDSIHAELPVRWDNMPMVKRTWPMRLRVARFRASADSMDAVVTGTVPVQAFLGDAELSGNLPITVQLDVHDAQARIVGREVRTVSVSRDSLPVGINGAWVRRIGRGNNVIRVDAEQADVERASSATADALVDTTSGFGLSDLLLGTNPRSTGTVAPARWRDVSIAPTTGVFSWAQPVGVIWEAYDLTPENGTVRYRVNVKLNRTFSSSLVGMVVRVIDFSKKVIERDGGKTGSVSVGYDQVRAAAPTVTDFLSVNLKGTVPGTYKLTIEIEDLVAKRSTSRSVELVLTRD